VKLSRENKKETNIITFITLNLFVFFVSVYLLTASGPNFYNTDASQLRFEVVKSIVERFDLSVPKGTGLQGSDGRDYSWLGIGSSLLAVPFYVGGEAIGVSPEIAVSIMNNLFGAATVVLVFLFSFTLGYSKRASIMAAIFYGLCTMAWPLAKHPFDHPIETFFVLLSVYFIYLRVVGQKTVCLLLSGISLGIAYVTRPTSILIMPSLFVFMIVYYSQKLGLKSIFKLAARDSGLFFLSFLPFLGLSFYYNYYRFGSIFETGYSLIALRTGIKFFTGTPFVTGLSGFLLSPGKGFFFYSPVAGLFFFSVRAFLRKHPAIGFSFLSIILSYLLFLSKNMNWHGDWAWGPRYLLVVTPFLIIPLAELLDTDRWLNKSFLRWTVYFFFTLGLVIQIVAVSVNFQKYFLILRFNEEVKFTVSRGHGVQPIVEPPAELYFDWRKSPIPAQFKFMYKTVREIGDYGYSNSSCENTTAWKNDPNPCLAFFDFWWAQKYCLVREYLILLISLILLSLYCASRLCKVLGFRHVREE